MIPEISTPIRSPARERIIAAGRVHEAKEVREATVARMKVQSPRAKAEPPLPVIVARVQSALDAPRFRAAASIRKIQLDVARHFGVELTELLGRYKTPAMMLPRHVAMYLCRKLTTKTRQEIGQSFGGRDHSSVLNSCRRIQVLMAADPSLRESVKYLMDEAMKSPMVETGDVA